MSAVRRSCVGVAVAFVVALAPPLEGEARADVAGLDLGAPVWHGVPAEEALQASIGTGCHSSSPDGASRDGGSIDSSDAGSSSGCGCRVAGSASSSKSVSGLGLGIALGLALARRRRRRT
jgi:MYXO-CTERM domain-containing protein